MQDASRNSEGVVGWVYTCNVMDGVVGVRGGVGRLSKYTNRENYLHA